MGDNPVVSSKLRVGVSVQNDSKKTVTGIAVQIVQVTSVTGDQNYRKLFQLPAKLVDIPPNELGSSNTR